MNLNCVWGIALKRNLHLRAQILGDQPRRLVSLPLQAGWLRITPNEATIFRKRLPADRDTPTHGYKDLFDLASQLSDGGSRNALESELKTARRLVMSLLSDNRQNFSELLGWAPLVEVSVYMLTPYLLEGLERMRPHVRIALTSVQPNADKLPGYYRESVHLLGRAMLLATDGGGSWLASMADAAISGHRIPSFPMTRERDLWSVLIGARAASRFGPSAIDRYLEVFGRASQPIRTLDALVGLAAIGLSHPETRATLIKLLDAERAKIPNIPLVSIWSQ